MEKSISTATSVAIKNLCWLLKFDIDKQWESCSLRGMQPKKENEKSLKLKCHEDQATSQDSKHFNHMDWVSFSQHNELRRTSRSQWTDNCVCKISKFKFLMPLKCASTLVLISSFNLLCKTENRIKLLNYFWGILIPERMLIPAGYSMSSAVGPISDSSSGLYSTKLHIDFSQHKNQQNRIFLYSQKWNKRNNNHTNRSKCSFLLKIIFNLQQPASETFAFKPPTKFELEIFLSNPGSEIKRGSEYSDYHLDDTQAYST